MASVFEQLQINYQGVTQSEDNNGTTTHIVFVGSKELVKEAFDELYHIGGFLPGYEEYGKISSMDRTPADGPFWHLTVNFEPLIGGGASTSNDTAPQNVSLSISMLSRPLETHPDYLKWWNYNLYCTDPNNTGFDGWELADEEDDKIPTDQVYPPHVPIHPESESHGPFYCWGKTAGECISLPQGYTWYKIQNMKKPGVNSYSFPTWQVSYTAKIRNISFYGADEDNSPFPQPFQTEEHNWAFELAPGYVTGTLPRWSGMQGKDRRLLNRINKATPKGCNWMCEGATLTREKNYYMVNLTFTMSGPGGWDMDLYDGVPSREKN